MSAPVGQPPGPPPAGHYWVWQGGGPGGAGAGAWQLKKGEPRAGLNPFSKEAAGGVIGGAITGYATGGVPGAIVGGAAGGAYGSYQAGQREKEESKGKYWTPADGSGSGGGNSMADVRARIEELRRQQYAQRTANLDQVMGFFGPVNAELKSIYGVDMPTFSPFGKGGPGGPPQLTRSSTLNPAYRDALIKPDASGIIRNPDVAAMPASPFTKAPLKPGITPSRLRNPKSLPPGVQDPTQDVPGTGQPWKRRYG